MKKIMLLAVLCAVTCISKAQISTDEKPYGLLIKEGRISTQSQSVSIRKKTKTFTAAYKAGIVREDLVNDAIPGPVRYAFAVPVNYTLENSGTWQEPEVFRNKNNESKIFKIRESKNRKI